MERHRLNLLVASNNMFAKIAMAAILAASAEPQLCQDEKCVPWRWMALGVTEWLILGLA